jgi:hypothetical protein
MLRIALSLSLLYNACIDDFSSFGALHVRSDFDGQMQTDEGIWSFSTV